MFWLITKISALTTLSGFKGRYTTAKIVKIYQQQANQQEKNKLLL